ncbi:polynucleotide kinase 3-phosphatase-like [hydrothermal vent metagenome]|uniref:Polynucleotide kinase 3-phosphatase-like n=1 Tax=hydrothermal vent metagenome TaxID=652676 RepID=A0A3B0YZ77_9ZZZZ
MLPAITLLIGILFFMSGYMLLTFHSNFHAYHLQLILRFVTVINCQLIVVIMEAVIFIGIQASGKSTFFHHHFQRTHVRINLDMLKTRHRESIMMNACVEAKQRFVVDNTNPTLEERNKYIECLKNEGFTIKGYYFQSVIADCLTRNKSRIGDERVPAVGVKATYNRLVLPNYQEGFDELFYVSMKNNKFVVREWKNEI